jgi:hypothetical protein
MEHRTELYIGTSFIEAMNGRGLVGNQNRVIRPKEAKRPCTIERLTQHFGSEEPGGAARSRPT